MMVERGVLVDHATAHRWALKTLPVLAAVFRRRKLPVGSSWRVDETNVLVDGQWKYLAHSLIDLTIGINIDRRAYSLVQRGMSLEPGARFR